MTRANTTETVDFIIVGAGSSGCVLANRLSQDPATSVALLEAGPRDSNPWIHIPIGYAKTIRNPDINWCYETEPEPTMDGRRIFWPRGKVLGGTSSINGLVYMRGHPDDYDGWAAAGASGWGWSDVLPYFKRSEDQVRGADAYHGVGGPLAVADLSERNPICQAFIDAANSAGVPANLDFNGESQDGVGYVQLTTRDGRRCSSAVAFLRPALRRPNLRVETEALVCRVVIEGGRAVGVEYLRGGERRVLRARSEVILCGGAVNSPQLLQLSGIGPAAHLASVAIEPVLDLPAVGANLQDHLQVRIVWKAAHPLTLNDIVRNPVRKLWMGARYLLNRSGPMTISACQVGLFARTRAELTRPDIQYHFMMFSAESSADQLHAFSGFTANVCQLRPESRGSVLIAAADPRQAPRIRANYLATETDRRAVIDGLRLARTIANETPLADFIVEEYLPGAGATSDDALAAHARQKGQTLFHPAGTCAIGPVLDPQLRVRGIEGLRVADCSVMPTLVSGNTNAPAVMIGEKASDLIRGQRSA